MAHLEDASGWERESAALRALARRLLADEHAAEDAVQETWLRALTRGPGGGERLGRWLETVLRNVVRDGHRVGGRRKAREAAAARDEALPSGTEIVERMEALQRLAAAVAALPEPYRTVVHLRYFEGQPPAALARRLDVPVETVRTRLKRGLALLRARMDDDCGGRRAWAAALVPVAQHATSSATVIPWVGGLVLGAKLKTTIALAVALTGTLAFVASRDSDPAREQDTASVAPPAEPPLEGVDPGPVAPDGAAPERGAVAPEPATPTDPVDPAPVAQEGIEVTGRVVIAGPDGTEYASTSGELELIVVQSPDRRDIRTIPFTDGSFTVTAPEHAFIGASRIEAEGRIAAIERTPFIVAPDAVMEVRAAWAKEGWLRVVDGETGAELSGVEVRRRWRWRAIGRALHPGDLPEVEVIATDAASPVSLPGLPVKWRTTVAHWVRAPGFAWQRTDIDLNSGGTRTVELAASGGLAVEVLGQQPQKPLRVRAFTPDRADGPSWDAALDVELDGTRASVIDLLPGPYVVRIDQGEFDTTLTLGRAEVEVRAGETGRVTVHLDPAALAVPLTHLHGTLALPEELRSKGSLILSPYPWDSLPGQGRVQLALSDLEPVDGAPDVLAWDAGEVQRGVYLAYVDEVQHRERIDVRTANETVHAIVVPPLAELVLTVVDGATGEPLEANVSWGDGALEGVHSNSFRTTHPDPETGRYTIIAPRGIIQVAAAVDGHATDRRDVQLDRDTELTIALERAAGVRVSFWEDDARVPIAMRVTLKSLRIPDTGEDVPMPTSTEANALELSMLLEPGRYEMAFTVPASEGFAQPAPVIVEVPAAEIVDLRVPVRK
ncbi:MAG: sigma-70 family RNA polymerase sigma factor [bacterium]|nr:sigma-70 family RNA polymerase sigma factor [bacterium]